MVRKPNFRRANSAFSLGEDDLGGQKPDPGAFRKKVEGLPGRVKSKKLSELAEKEVLAGQKVL